MPCIGISLTLNYKIFDTVNGFRTRSTLWRIHARSPLIFFSHSLVALFIQMPLIFEYFNILLELVGVSRCLCRRHYCRKSEQQSDMKLHHLLSLHFHKALFTLPFHAPSLTSFRRIYMMATCLGIYERVFCLYCTHTSTVTMITAFSSLLFSAFFVGILCISLSHVSLCSAGD